MVKPSGFCSNCTQTYELRIQKTLQSLIIILYKIKGAVSISFETASYF
jgi:hypothetical protein